MRQTDSDSKTDKGTKKGRARESDREKDGETKDFFYHYDIKSRNGCA